MDILARVKTTPRNGFLKNLLYDFPIFLICLNYLLHAMMVVEGYTDAIRFLAMLFLIVSRGKAMRLSSGKWILIALALLGMPFHLKFSSNLVYILLFCVFSLRDTEEEIRHMYWISLICVVITFLLLKFGFAINYTNIIGVRTRSTLGFYHPNATSLFYASAVYLFALSRKKITLLTIAITEGAAILIYSYTDSRTEIIALSFFTLLLTLFYIQEKRKIKSKIFEKLCLLFIDALFLSHVFLRFFLGALMPLDRLLSGRITGYVGWISRTSLLDFLIGGNQYVIENFFLSSLFSYGIVFYAPFALFVHHSVKVLIYEGKREQVAFLTSMFTYGMAESAMIHPEFLCVLLAWEILFSATRTARMKTALLRILSQKKERRVADYLPSRIRKEVKDNYQETLII